MAENGISQPVNKADEGIGSIEVGVWVVACEWMKSV